MVRQHRQAGFTILETIFVVALIGVISAIAVPMFGNALSDFRLSGDARSVSNAVALAKMRAASRFTRVRLYVDLAGESHHLEYWDKDASSWTADGGATSLSSGIAFSYGIVGAPPPST